MIRPVRFGFNDQTALSNSFQVKAQANKSLQEKALHEFDGFVSVLRANGINVMVVDDTPEPYTPDSIFPNNWLSTHPDGTLYLYPMAAENRRAERRPELIELLRKRFLVSKVNDLSSFEDEHKFLESTGSMVLDRTNRIAYACLSPRTHPQVLEKFSGLSGYKIVTFLAVNHSGQAIYHTNVLMSIGSDFAVICLDFLPNEKEKNLIVNELKRNGKEIIEITVSQISSFAGNILELKTTQNAPVIVLSEQAFLSLNKSQLTRLENHGQLVNSSLQTIEAAGGGSARCMIAEIFLPVR